MFWGLISVTGLNFSNAFGVSMALLSTLIWSSYWILNRQDQREPVLGLALNFLFAVPILTLILWVTGDLSGLTTGVALQGWLGGLYVGLVEIGLAFVFWLYAMKLATNTARVANLIFLSPFLSLFFIATFLNETIYSSTLMGLGLIIIGLGIRGKNGASKLKNRDPRKDTLLINAGRSKEYTGRAVNPKIVRASTIVFDSVADMHESGRRRLGPVEYYGRRGTSTTFAFQQAMCQLEEAAGCFVYPSGTSALTTALLAFLNQGDHLLMVDSAYEPTRDFCVGTLSEKGVEVSFTTIR